MTTANGYKSGDKVRHNGKELTIASTDYDVLRVEDSKGRTFIVSAFDVDPSHERRPHAK